jgi:serine/threonine protein kinase
VPRDEDSAKDSKNPLGDTVPADSDPDKAISPTFFKPGDVVGGSYVVREVLGYGGMGVVYEAEDRELDRLVALKVPLVIEYAQALRREAQAMAQVRHPNLVSVYSIGRHEGLDFIVMERLVGKTLEAHIEAKRAARQPITVDHAVDLLLAVTDALTAVHRAGLAHRDVKTANVMLASDRVVLTDLGLVLPEFAVKGNKAIAGSADYMAPEVIAATVRRGRTAGRSVRGRRPRVHDPHGARALPEEGLEETLRAHIHAPIPDLREERPDVPAELAELVSELLAKTPEQRPESAESLLWRLQALRITRPPRRGLAALSVLIVDDQEEVCAVLKRGLLYSLPGISVESSTDPVRALARAEEQAFDVVVVDLHMPKMNGLEVALSLLSLPDPRPTVVAMSGEASDADVAVLGDVGIAAFVPKDVRFVARMCNVIGDVRRKRSQGAAPSSRGSSRGSFP